MTLLPFISFFVIFFLLSPPLLNQLGWPMVDESMVDGRTDGKVSISMRRAQMAILLGVWDNVVFCVYIQ